MWNVTVDACNAFAKRWSWWLGVSLIDAAIVLVLVSLLWWAIRRKASPQLGCLLFLLVPLKLFIPLEIVVPERLAAWTPGAVSQVLPQPSITGDRDSNAVSHGLSAYRDPWAASQTMPSVLLSEPDLLPAPPQRNTTPAPSLAAVAQSQLTLRAWLMLAWATGIIVLSIRLIVSQVRFHRLLLREAAPVDPQFLGIDFDELRQRMGIRRPIRMVESPKTSSPVVWGIFWPTLILPAGFASSLPKSQLEWVLLHELAHVRRRDLWVRCFQSLATILHFANPAIWAANRTINRLREFACDDMATACGNGSPLESGEAFLGVMRYAASMQEIAPLKLDGAIGVFESTTRASCFERMKRLLDTNRRLSVRLGLGSLCILLLTAALALPQIRAANQQTPDAKANETEMVAANSADDAAKGDVTADKAEEQRPAEASAAAAEKKDAKEQNDDAGVYRFSVVIAKHVLLLEGKDIVTWPQVEERIAKRPNPSRTHPSFYTTRGADEAGLYESSKENIWRLHRDYKLVGHSEGSLSLGADMRYDRVQTPADLKPDEALRVEGNVVDRKGAPIVDAEVILVTPIVDDVVLVQGHVRNPIEHVMTHSTEQGRFALYPPKTQNYTVIALHPDAGIGVSRRDQFANDHRIQLLEWAGLESEFSAEPEKQDASIRTRLPSSGDMPEIVFYQYWSDLKKKETRLFSFTHVPPIFQTTISRTFQNKEGGSFSLPGASLELLPGETRRLDFGPLTDQQRRYLDQIRRDSEEGQNREKPETAGMSSNANQTAPSKTSENELATTVPNASSTDTPRFELTILGPDKKPVPKASVEIRGDAIPGEKDIQRGAFVKKGEHGTFFQADSRGILGVNLPRQPKRLDVNITQPGFGPYWAAWSAEEHPEDIPSQFTAELEAGWSIGGIIVDEEERPQEGVNIHPNIEFKKRPGDKQQLGIGTQVKTSAEGRWRFDSVPVSMDSVFVEISHPGFVPTRSSLSRKEFGISPGNQPEMTMCLDYGVSVSGKVTDEAGKPIAGALIRTKFGNDIRENRTNDRGEYCLFNCEARMARLVVSAKGKATDMKEVSLTSPVAPDGFFTSTAGPVNFEMKPGGKVRIRVLDKNGNRAAKARIFFQRWRGMFQYFEFDHVDQYADENGMWEWNEAPLDEFQADICPPDGMQLSLQRLIARDEEYVFHTYPKLVIVGKVFDAETKEPIKAFRVVPGWRSMDQYDPPGKPHSVWTKIESYLAESGQYRIQRDHAETAHLVRIEANGYQVATSRDIKSDEGNVQVDFGMVRAKDIAATVLTPDGQPAAGAKIAVGIAGSQIIITNGEFDDRSTDAAARCVADDAGRFRIPSREGPYQVGILHSTGFAHLRSAEQEIPDKITLAAWARVEGTFRVGAKVMANAPIVVSTDCIHSHGEALPNISTFCEKTTDAEGRFIFERVFPGRGWLGRGIVLMVDQGATDVTSSIRLPAVFPPGKTTQLDLGGTGRAIVGKLLAHPGFRENVLWQFAMVDVQVDRSQLKSPPIPADIDEDPEQRKVWWDDWKTTDEGKAWQAESEAYEKLRSTTPEILATVDRDGSFRIDDVPPGNYALSVRFHSHRAGYLSDYCFTVPPVADASDEPLDLGELTLEKD